VLVRWRTPNAHEHLQQRLDGAGDLAAESVPLGVDRLDARNAGDVGSGSVELGLHLQRGEMPQLRERADVDETSRAQDRDAVADRLHLREDVGGEEDRLAVLARLVDALRNARSFNGSRPEVGSSSRRSSARDISAAIRISFCRFPFE